VITIDARRSRPAVADPPVGEYTAIGAVIVGSGSLVSR
jgi:hypothetical protein